MELRRRRLILVATIVAIAPGIVLLLRPRRPSLGETLPQAEGLVLYEGLPHQMYEEDAYRAEVSSAKTIQLAGYPFYQTPLTLRGEDLKSLRAMLEDGDLLDEFTGEKKCGGFHPDYAVEWSSGGETFRVFLCFGCGEALVEGPRGKVERYDLVRGKREGLIELLKKQRKNRPPHERFGPLAAQPTRAMRHFR